MFEGHAQFSSLFLDVKGSKSLWSTWLMNRHKWPTLIMRNRWENSDSGQPKSVCVCVCVWSTGICGICTHAHIRLLVHAHSVTHCSSLPWLARLFGPSVISPGRSEWVSRATSLRPCSKNGRHGYFESQLWPLEHAQKRALSTTWGGVLRGRVGERWWLWGETSLFNS